MPLVREQFLQAVDNLTEAIDVDDSRGRSCPINMNLVEEGYLSKDTGVSLFGATETALCHSLFHYKKKNGTSYILRAKETKLQVYNNTTGAWDDLSPTYTAGAEFGFAVYDDTLWGSNGVESFFKWDGSSFTEYSGAPKGNILEVFEDKMFVAGVTAEPLTVYYSKTADPTDWSDATRVLKPVGTDAVTNLKNYYGTLLIFKAESIWKMTTVFNAETSTLIPQLEIQSNNYGACSRKAVAWVENDLWFFTGREVRAIGFRDQQTGVLGVNKSVISDQIKETLYTISASNYSKVACFYNNRRFYLAVPLNSTTNDTIFVCHLLYGNAWTKYQSRIKAQAHDFMAIDGVVYTTKSATAYGVLKWDETLLNDNGTAISSEAYFKKIEEKDFNKFNLFRYLDLMFKNIQGRVTVTIYKDAYDVRQSKVKTFSVGTPLENEENTLGEIDSGQSLVGDAFGETVVASPFEKKRLSFLVKAQSVVVGLSNSNTDETFTICQYALVGSRQPRKLTKPSSIVSIR